MKKNACRTEDLLREQIRIRIINQEFLELDIG